MLDEACDARHFSPPRSRSEQRLDEGLARTARMLEARRLIPAFMRCGGVRPGKNILVSVPTDP